MKRAIRILVVVCGISSLFASIPTAEEYALSLEGRFMAGESVESISKSLETNLLFTVYEILPYCYNFVADTNNHSSLINSVATNSICSDISLEDGVAVSFSQADSQISLSPFDDDWAAIDDGTLFGDLTVVSGASNIVSVLFGDIDNPAFTIESDGQWTILPSGRFASHMNVPLQLPMQTNRLSFVMRIPHGQPHLEALDSTTGTRATNLPPVTWLWENPAHYPENWQAISLQLAGPKAQILDFRLKWRPDGTQLILR